MALSDLLRPALARNPLENKLPSPERFAAVLSAGDASALPRAGVSLEPDMPDLGI